MFDADAERASRLVEELKRLKPKVARTIEEVVSESLDVVVEAASQEAVRMHSTKILLSGKDLVIISTRALLDEELRRSIVEAARRGGSRVYVPSGAIGGLDSLKAASTIGIDELTLTTVKEPKSLGLDGVGGPAVIFEGDAEEAVKRFPPDVNVAAAIALATGKKPRVRVVANPNAKENIHVVYAKGDFGEIVVAMRNKKVEGSPRTSLIAALSVVRLLRQLSDGVIVVGT